MTDPGIAPNRFAHPLFSVELTSETVRTGIDDATVATLVSTELWSRLPFAVQESVRKREELLQKRNPETQRPSLSASLVKVSERDGSSSKNCGISVADYRVVSYLATALAQHHFVSLSSARVTKPLLTGKQAAKKFPDPAKLNMDTDDFDNISSAVQDAVGEHANDTVWEAIGSTIDVPLSDLASADPIPVRTLLDFVEANVKYAGWLNAEGDPSRFAIAVRAVHGCQLKLDTLKSFITGGAKHKPYARLAAAMYARFVLAPEDLLDVIRPLLEDPTIVAVSEDGTFDPVAVSEFAEQLIEADDLYEAWFPLYHDKDLRKAELETVKEEIAEKKRQQEASGDSGADGNSAAVVAGTSTGGAKKGKSALLGMRSIASLLERTETFRREAARNAVRQREEDERDAAENIGGGSDGEDLGFSEEDSGDEAIGAGQNGTGVTGAERLATKRKRRETSGKKFLSQNGKHLLQLVGRSAPERPQDPVFLRF